MKFITLAQTFDRFEQLSGNALRSAVAAFLKSIPSSDIKSVVYLTQGSIASEFDDVNLGMAAKSAMAAIASASSEDEHQIVLLAKKVGDIGTVAEKYATARSGLLSVKDVFDGLHRISVTSGTGSQEKKASQLMQLLKKCTPLEARYLARLVVGALRLGLASKTILDGLANAYATKDTKKELEHAYNICPDIGLIAETVAKKGITAVRKIDVMVGRPVQMMLCQRVSELPDVFNRLGSQVAAEQKYDGERVQVHKQGTKVTLYSRRLENITTQFPDIVLSAQKLKAQSCIFEGEIMAVKGDELLPFQTLMSRRRKHGVDEMTKSIPVRLFAFELIYLNGKSLLHSAYTLRYSKLQTIIKGSTGIALARRVVCSDTDCIEELFESVVGKGGEGVVIKSLQPDSTYQAGVRGWHWIKWKPEYSEGMQDTFDLVVIGAYWGRGRRAGSYGGLLCAVYDKKKDRFESVCKVGSGFSDDDLQMFPKVLKKANARLNNVVVLKNMEPDVWIVPNTVIEVLAAEITKSPFHTAGGGLALRFPRYIRIRNDKTPQQATTSDELKRMATR